MFNLLRKKSAQYSTIVIEGLSTLTNDTMTVASTWQPQNASASLSNVLSKTITSESDPIDTAIQTYLETSNTPKPRQQPIHTIVFDATSGVSGNVWHHGSYYLPTIKGMPERIFELCDISDNEREVLTTQLHTMAATGNTIIAIATGLLQHELTDLQQLKHTEKLSFIGFVSLEASVSSSAKRLTGRKNTTVYLITGQHPTAAYTIANQLKMASNPNDIHDARRLDVMGDAEVESTIESVKIFARATPTHKKRILDVLHSSDKTVIAISTAAELDKLLAN